MVIRRQPGTRRIFSSSLALILLILTVEANQNEKPAGATGVENGQHNIESMQVGADVDLYGGYGP